LNIELSPLDNFTDSYYSFGIFKLFLAIIAYSFYYEYSNHVTLQKGCTRLTAASDKVYQLLAHGRWFSPGTPASSTTKTGHHDIAESGGKHNQNQIKNRTTFEQWLCNVSHRHTCQ
jgi:hypothetical protein